MTHFSRATLRGWFHKPLSGTSKVARYAQENRPQRRGCALWVICHLQISLSKGCPAALRPVAPSEETLVAVWHCNWPGSPCKCSICLLACPSDCASFGGQQRTGSARGASQPCRGGLCVCWPRCTVQTHGWMSTYGRSLCNWATRSPKLRGKKLGFRSSGMADGVRRHFNVLPMGN